MLSEILVLGLFSGSDHKVSGFADAVNGKLSEMALANNAARSWQLVRAEPPTRR